MKNGSAQLRLFSSNSYLTKCFAVDRIYTLQQQVEAYKDVDDTQQQRRNRIEDVKQETATEDIGRNLLMLIRDTLYRRCQDRPFNGLKKAFTAVTESPGKVHYTQLRGDSH